MTNVVENNSNKIMKVERSFMNLQEEMKEWKETLMSLKTKVVRVEEQTEEMWTTSKTCEESLTKIEMRLRMIREEILTYLKEVMCPEIA